MFLGLSNIAVCFFTEPSPNFSLPWKHCRSTLGALYEFQKLETGLGFSSIKTKRTVELPCKKTDYNSDWKDEVQVLKCFGVSTVLDIKGVENKKIMMEFLDV